MSDEGHVAGEIMKKQEPGKNNLTFSGPRVTGANSMSRKGRKSSVALWLMAAILIADLMSKFLKEKGLD